MFENLSIVIPFRPKTEERRQIFEWVYKRTLQIPPGAEVIVSSDDRNTESHFSRAMAINNGVLQATRDYICIIDGDVIIDVDVYKRALEAIQNIPFVILFDRIKYLSKETSELVLNMDPKITYADLEKIGPKIVGQYPNGVGTATMVRRKNFIEMGGFDESLVGWGYEDNVFHATYSMFFEKAIPLKSYIYHIHHSHSNNPIPQDYNEKDYFSNEYKIILQNNPVMRNKLIWEEYCKVKDNKEKLLAYLKNNLKSPFKSNISL